MRRFIALLLVCLSFWQAASAAGLTQAMLEQDAGLAHLAMHWEEAAHHHHDADGSIHADSSQDSIQHVMADCSTHHLGIIVMLPVAALEPASHHVAQAASHPPPPPYLDGLRRPPRSLS